MSITLRRGEAVFDLMNAGWGHALTLAEQNGWQPAGTLAPRDYVNAEEYIDAGKPIARLSGWQGGYGTSDCQEVTAEDARDLADGLERALEDIPRHDAVCDKTEPVPGLVGARRICPGENVNACEWFSGGNRGYLEDLIAFCQDGGFEIR